MRSRIMIFLMLGLALSGLAPTVAADDHTVTVHLTVDGEEVFPFNLPPYNEAPVSAACDVTVATGATGGDVLDQAVEDGCIGSWDHHVDPQHGKFVDAIDGTYGHCGPGDDPPGLWPAVCSFWEFKVNGESASEGISFYQASPGDQVAFHYNRGVWEEV